MNIFDERRNWKIICLKLSIISIVLLIIIFGLSFDKIIYNDEYESLTEYFNINNEMLIATPILSSGKGFISFGNSNASLTIIEFVDYESPFSKKFHAKVYNKIKENYIDTGLINYILIDNPILKVHKKSLLYAQAIHCANEQNKSEKYHDLLLSKKSVSESDINMFANNLSLNYSQFRNCIDTKKYELDILEEIKYSKNNNIIQSPTLIIDDIKIEGVKTIKEIKKIIDEKLNES